LTDAADIALHPIEVERFIAVLPSDHRLAGVNELRLKDLSGDSFMAFPPDKIPSLHAKFLMACEESGFSPRIALEAWQMSSMVSLVAAGMGIALLPAQVRKIAHPGVVYKELADQSKHIELKIAMAWRLDNVHEEVRAMLTMAGTLDKSRFTQQD
jgi:DNA-binding transcriptional LysR family regulator